MTHTVGAPVETQWKNKKKHSGTSVTEENWLFIFFRRGPVEEGSCSFKSPNPAINSPDLPLAQTNKTHDPDERCVYIHICGAYVRIEYNTQVCVRQTQGETHS